MPHTPTTRRLAARLGGYACQANDPERARRNREAGRAIQHAKWIEQEGSVRAHMVRLALKRIQKQQAEADALTARIAAAGQDE